GCSAQHDPVVELGDLDERLDPSTGTDQSLLVEDEERILHIHVLRDVVPGVYGEDSVRCGVPGRAYAERCGLSRPVELVTLTSRCDHVQILRGLSFKVIGHGRD